MESLEFFLKAFVGGFYFFITEECLTAWMWESLIVGSLVAVPLLVWTPRRAMVMAWALCGAVGATATALMRVGGVRGLYVSYLAGINPFGAEALTGSTYVCFALSGVFAASIVSRRQNLSLSQRIFGLFLINLGVLYHLKVAQDWYIRPPMNLILGFGEFLAPAVFAAPLVYLISAGAEHSRSATS